MSLGSREGGSTEGDAFLTFTALRRLLRKAREVGPFYTLTLSVRRVLPARFLYIGRMILLEMRPYREGTAEETRDGIRWASGSDSELLTAFGHSRELVQRRLSAGDSVCIFTEAERLLGYVWFHGVQHEDEGLGVRFHLAPEEIWLFDAMIAADRRGHGLYPRLLRAAAEGLWNRGLSRILIAVDASNKNSVRAHLAAGACPAGSIRILRLCGLTCVYGDAAFRVAWTGATGWLQLSTDFLTAKA